MRSVVIIDDSLTVRMDLKQAFEAAAFHAIVCGSIAAARETLSRSQFDLIVLDPMLADGQGIELLKELRADARISRVPVILLAAEADGIAADACFSKPYQRAQVVEQAKRLLRDDGSADPAQTPAGSRRILAVDDSATYLHALAEHLRLDGYDVALAHSGEQALEQLASQSVDCILLDLVMPGLSGEETCRRIKAAVEWRGIPVIMLTAQEDRQVMIASFNAGADDYIAKSSEFEVLRARLRAQLRRKDFEDENRNIRERLYQKDAEAAQTRIQREADEAARVLAQQWQDTFDAISDGVCLIDPELKVLRANQALSAIIGRSADRVSGRPLQELLPPALQSICGMLLPRLLESRHRQTADARSGERWYRCTADPVQSDGSSPAGAVLILSDITEQKRGSEALRLSEERYRGTFENAAVGIGHNDVNGRWLQVNQQFCELLGYTRDEMLAKSLQDVTYHEDLPGDLRQFRLLMRGEIDSYTAQKRYAHKNGALIWASVTRGLQRDSAGRPLYAISIIQDIRDRKRAEEQLHLARDVAEQASKAKDHFLAVLSHELRNPLSPVLATVSMLQADPRFDPDTQEGLEVIRRNVELEARLIDDLLDVTRISRGKIELDKQPVELCTVIRRAVEVCEPDIEARQLHFGVDLGPDAPYVVEADVARLQQVFWNLLKNAVKFTPPGGCVGIRCRSDAEGNVVAEVNDSGAGIAADALPRIFNAFEQAERSITRQFGGLGLGLTISKTLVEMHGGSIEARSDGKEKGATFTVKLPMLRTRAANGTTMPQASTSTSRPPNAPATPARRLRILVVEDHGDTARTMCRLLSRWGHDVRSAGDVATALHMVEAAPHSFDLMLSDLGLPDGSGMDLLRALRSKGVRFPAIALSGYGQEQDMQQSRDAGFLAHLVKPVSITRLEEAISQIARTLT